MGSSTSFVDTGGTRRRNRVGGQEGAELRRRWAEGPTYPAARLCRSRMNRGRYAMTPEQEQQVLESLYDRLYDAVTYAPGGKESAFPKNAYFQMTKNAVL